MRLVLLSVTAGVCFFAAAFFRLSADSPNGADSEAVSCEVFAYPYFVKNTVSPPEGEEALVLRIDSLENFNEIFGVGMVMGKRPKLVDEDYFKTHEIGVLIFWGDTPWEYAVSSAERSESELIVKVVKTGTPNPSARFASPLILGVGRDELADIETIRFVVTEGDDAEKGEASVFAVER